MFSFIEQHSQDKEYVSTPVSRITVQTALEKGKHLYRRDPVTGAMVHSQNCPNPIIKDSIRKD